MIRRGRGRYSEDIMLHQHRRAPTEVVRRDNVSPAEQERQRVDKWLWHARVVRTRLAAAALVSSGYVRVNGAPIRAPGRIVRSGDVITVALERAVRVLKVTGFIERRGPAEADRGLYEELT
jgi:ribosome-associated heat shock protein Hsp15